VNVDVVVDLGEVLTPASNQQLCCGSDDLIWSAMLQSKLPGDIKPRNSHMQLLNATERLEKCQNVGSVLAAVTNVSTEGSGL
jgi:hypothetical protein